MKLEVLINDTDPKIYSLDKDKIVIGSHENSHIIINDPSISRKHAIILTKDDRYFISDQGSINGTFVGEEALTPGKRIEMSIYSPVRLGTNVLLTLITEEEASELEEVLPLNEFEVKDSEEKTVVISYSELKKRHTEEMQKKRASQLTQRKKKVKKKNQKWSSLPFIVILLSLFGLIIYKRSERKTPIKKETVTLDLNSVKRVELDKLLKNSFLIETFKSPKCSSDFEKSLCMMLPSINHKNFGPVVVDKDIIIFADNGQVKERARNGLPQNHKERDLRLMSLITWIQSNIQGQLKEIKSIDSFRITIALMETRKDHTELLLNAMFVPSSLILFQERLSSENFENAKKNGIVEFYYYLDYGRFADMSLQEN